MFANILATLSPGTSPTPVAQTDLLSQLSALIANGTPLSKIVDQISKNVSSALQKQLAGQLPQSDLDQLTSSVTQSIANALAPPGNGPPGTPQQQASALANRLRRLIESLARESTGNVGQLNDIAGSILDAKSAKETPAQTQGTQTASTLDVSSLVSSLLANAVGSLQTLHGNPLQGPALSRNLRGDPLQGPALDRNLRGDPLQGSNLDRNVIPLVSSTPSLAQAPQRDSSITDPSESNVSPDTSPTSAITMQNAPDLLARMLVRAAGTDARINGLSALGSGTAPQGASTPNSGLAARLESLLANISTGAVNAAQSSNAFAGSGSGNSFDQQLAGGQQPVLGTHDTSSQTANVAVPGFAQFAQVQQLAQNAQGATPYVNASAVIEQMIKGLSMRTNAQGSSEIRLHLQPENLGDVTMKITVSGSQISASVVASNNEVRNALVSNQQHLARSLADAGLTLSGFSVDVSGGNAGRDRQNNDRASGFGRRYTVHELPGAQTTETSALASLGPPLLSGSSLALFNYLA